MKKDNQVEKYAAIEDATVLVDTETKQVTDKANLKPFDIIREVCKENNISYMEPKFRCKKCMGRGYTGTKAGSGEPIPCNCIFTKEQIQQKQMYYQPKPTRKEKRMMRKQLSSASKLMSEITE